MFEGHPSAASERKSPPYKKLVGALVRESAQDPEDRGYDEGRSIAAATLCDDLAQGSSLIEPLEMFTHLRKGSAIPEKLNLLHSSLIYFAALDGRNIPMTYEENKINLRRFKEMYHTGQAEKDPEKIPAIFYQTTEALFFRDLQTTMASRYSTTEFIMQVHKDRFPHGARVLDVGCSVGQGLKSLAMKEQIGHSMVFPPLTIYDQDGQVDNYHTVAHAEILERSSQFREGVGIDLQVVDDPDVHLWARCNLRHAERNNPKFMAAYDRLDNEIPHNVTFGQANFTNARDIQRFIDSQHGKTFDIVVYNTVIYQMARAGLRHALERIPDLLGEEGICVVQEAAEVVGSGLHDISLDPASWSQRTTRPWGAFAWDNSHPELGWQKLFSSEDSRFTRVAYGAGKLALRDEILPVREWIHQV